MPLTTAASAESSPNKIDLSGAPVEKRPVRVYNDSIVKANAEVNGMIKKLVRQMLTAQIFSALTVSLCLLIDNLMIGNFLGVGGQAAYGLANPILLVIGAIGTMLSAGVQVACSKSLGQGSQEETDRGYSSAVALAGGVSAVLLIAVLVFASPLATAMGAGDSGELFLDTRAYLRGFIVGAPGCVGALILVPFMQMAGQSTLLIAAVLGMTVADVALDLLNVLVFRGGMFGMGLASSLSYYVALVIGAFYFLSKKCVFRFSPRLIARRKIAELLRSGVPAVFSMASTVVLTFVLNRILLGTGGADAVAAFTVITTIGNASNAISTGVGGVSLTLSGVFFAEEDRTSLKTFIGLMARYSVMLGAAVGILLAAAAPWAVRLFIPAEGAPQSLAILGVRLFALGLIPCCVNNALKNTFQGTGRILLTEITSVAEGALIPIAVAAVTAALMGTRGVWLYFALGEALTLVLLGIYIYRRTGRMPWRDGACLLLDGDFGAADGNMMEWDIRTIEEVASASRQAEEFCLRRGQDDMTSSRIALCVEEMAANTVQYGFGAQPDRRHLSVRLLKKPDRFVLRFRDDCRAFDPVNYVPAEGKDALGIRLVMAMADEIRYTFSLNLNNLTIVLRTGK